MNCSRERAPRITEETAGRAATQAMAIWAMDTPRPSATLRTASRICQVWSDWPRWFQIRMPSSAFSTTRVPGAGGSPRSYLPVSHPLASGDQASRPSPASWQAGTISHSMARASRLYCGCSDTGADSPRASAVSTAFCSCQPVKLESPGN